MTTDVNEAFAGERAAQIAGAYAARDQAVARQQDAAAAFDRRLAEGKLTDLGGGRFRVDDPGSYDNGEVLSLVRPRPGEIPLILPEHGLEEAGGKASVYAAVPMWHNLGSVIPGGTSDIDTVIRLGGLDFEVVQRPVHYFDSAGGLRGMPGQFVNERTDTGAGLGVVGRIYASVQPRDSLAFLQHLVDKQDVVFESAGVLRGGARTFVSVRLPDTVRVDPGGIDDRVVPFVAIMDDHSGNGRFQAVVTPWRPVCANTNRYALRDAVTRWGVAHTTTIPARIKEARRTLGLTVKAYEAFAAEETRLAQTDITISEFQALMASLWEPKDPEEASKRSLTLERRRAGALTELFATESGRVGRTAYAAEQAVTAYLDHAAPRRVVGDRLAAARATAIMEGADDEVKSRAHRLLLLAAGGVERR